MSSTNKTSNYELSQFVGTDIPSILTDYNGDMRKIDTAISEISESAGSSASAVSAMNTRLTSAEQDIDTLEGNVNTLTENVTANTASIATNTANIASNASAITTAEQDIDALETTVGDANSGLVKAVADNASNIATDEANIATIGTDVNTLKTTVGGANSGLVKDVADNTSAITANTADIVSLQTVVGDANSGLVKAVADNTADIAGIETRTQKKEIIKEPNQSAGWGAICTAIANKLSSITDFTKLNNVRILMRSTNGVFYNLNPTDIDAESHEIEFHGGYTKVDANGGDNVDQRIKINYSTPSNAFISGYGCSITISSGTVITSGNDLSSSTAVMAGIWLIY